jgi:hypothetical protein
VLTGPDGVLMVDAKARVAELIQAQQFHPFRLAPRQTASWPRCTPSSRAPPSSDLWHANGRTRYIGPSWRARPRRSTVWAPAASS